MSRRKYLVRFGAEMEQDEKRMWARKGQLAYFYHMLCYCIASSAVRKNVLLNG